MTNIRKTFLFLLIMGQTVWCWMYRFGSEQNMSLTSIRHFIRQSRIELTFGHFLSGFGDRKIMKTNVRVARKPRLEMRVDKNGISLNLTQLSDGEKCTMALFGDLARRLTIANPNLDDPLLGEGGF